MQVHNFVLLTILIGVSVISPTICAENIDANDIERFCYPESHKNTRKSCECNNENAPPWGLRALNIDCSFKDLHSKDFSEVLPLYSAKLDLAWNSLDMVPNFYSDSLRLLNMMHNNISKVIAKNFVNVSNLRELYLNWNSIQIIEATAFEDLAHLKILDLSHNNLHALSVQVFGPMLILESLSLSWNRQLNHTTGIQELDFYKTFGVNPKLQTLKIEACSLTTLILPEKAPLTTLDLRHNLITKLPEKLPDSLEKLDISENLLESLLPSDTKRLKNLRKLYLEDMPRLQLVAENSFVPMESLQKVSFQNSRRLTAFDGHAFGANGAKMLPLRTIIFRGTTLHTFNSTLLPVFQQLDVLDLNGMPLYCDCQLVWLKDLRLETNGRCFRPSRMRGMRLTNAPASDFSCNPWPRWVYGIIILGLIVLCSVGIYLIVMGLRPHRGVAMRRKVGAGSPYARVTIEPNRQENNFY